MCPSLSASCTAMQKHTIDCMYCIKIEATATEPGEAKIEEETVIIKLGQPYPLLRKHLFNGSDSYVLSVFIISLYCQKYVRGIWEMRLNILFAINTWIWPYLHMSGHVPDNLERSKGTQRCAGVCWSLLLRTIFLYFTDFVISPNLHTLSNSQQCENTEYG